MNLPTLCLIDRNLLVWIKFLICLVIFAFLSASAEVDEVDPTIVSAIQYQNMGLAYLEESQPLKAVTQFENLIGLLPNEAIGYANLAVAYLRLRQVDAAEKVIQRGISAVPLNSQLHFIYSEIYHFQGKSGQAVTELKEALRLKPDDLEVRYLLIRENLRDRRNTEAISKAIIDLRFLRELTPANIVVLLKLSQALLLSDEDVEQVEQIGKELRILLSDIDSEKLKYLDEGMRQVEVEDIKGANRNFRIFENINKNSPRYQQGIGELITPILGHPIEEFDQRFKSRLVATQTKPIVVSFSQLVHHAMISRGQELTGLQIDYDHDGDLDNLTVFPDRIQMHRNDGNDSFLDVSDRTFSPSPDYGGQSVTSGDFDNDGDLDIIIASVSRGCLLLDNLRQGKLEVTHILSELKRPVAVDSADYDHDGALDICVTTKIDTQLYLNRGDGMFIKDLTLMSLGGMDVHFVDYDNDGHLDVWVVDKRRMSLFRNDGTSKFSDVSSLIPTFSPLDLPVKKTTEVTSQDNASGKSDWVDGQVEDYDNDGDLDLLVGTWDDRFLIQNEGGNQNGWLQIELEAVAAGNNKNNAYGLGSRVEIKAGDLYQMTYVEKLITDYSSEVDPNLESPFRQRSFVHFGLGPIEQADVLRIVWTNGVPQNVISPRTNQRILEKQVLKGSCPFLYVFDGEKFQFKTDLLWRSALGMITSIGTVASSDSSRDYVLLGHKMKPRDGTYSIQITEELWETTYFDQVQLIAVDHPVGTQIFIDERFTPLPFPEFEVHAVREMRFPKSAIDHQGQDVSMALGEFDYKYAVEHKPGKFQGVVDQHFIELDLGDIEVSQKILLFLTGWVFPTDTSINVAISQNPSINLRFPYLQVKTDQGEWQTVIDLIGIPAGKNKTLIIDLTDKFLSGDRRLRIVTNMQVYWDRAFFTLGDHDVSMQVTRQHPDRADLHYLGFPKMYRPTPHAPHLYDYSQIDKKGQWRDLGGFYTRYGAVGELLQKSESMSVIMNAGDEITVEFDVDQFPTLKNGWIRSFILFSDGWVKDGDINTLASQRVEPLPFHGATSYPPKNGEHFPDGPDYLRYRLKYNTRRVSHRLPRF